MRAKTVNRSLSLFSFFTPHTRLPRTHHFCSLCSTSLKGRAQVILVWCLWDTNSNTPQKFGIPRNSALVLWHRIKIRTCMNSLLLPWNKAELICSSRKFPLPVNSCLLSLGNTSIYSSYPTDTTLQKVCEFGEMAGKLPQSCSHQILQWISPFFPSHSTAT